MRNVKQVFGCATLLTSIAVGAAFAQAPVIDLNQSERQQQQQQFNSSPPQTYPVQQYTAPNYPNPGYRSDMYAEPTLSAEDELRVLRQQVNAFAQLDLPGKIDALQQQVQELNGRLEVQAHHIETLTEQQKSFYEDLNQRLIQMQTVGSAGSLEISKGILQAQGNVSQSVSSVDKKADDALPVPTTPVSVDSEEKAYQDAFSLLIKKQNAEAITAFNALLTSYPQGKRVANAHYWLGELYSSENKNDLAAEHLNTLVTQYPNDDKVPDAMLKLAIIDDNNGQSQKAQAALKQIISKYPNSSAARLANMRLIQMMNL
jgi:tol-pal system protein YbgF